MEANLDYEEVLMAKTAWYYYSENLTQQQISDLLGINRMRVIKLLDKAKQSGIIQFKIRSDSAKRLEIEQALMRRYGLKDCFIVPSPLSDADINGNVAKAASMYICNRISGETFINIGYGDTSSRILNHLAISTEYTLSCVSLTGGVSYYLPNATSSTFNSRLYLMPAPLLASTEEMAEAMRNEKSVQDIAQLTLLSPFTVIGIGSIDSGATILKTGILNQNDFLLLTRNGAVGDILSHFINANGEVVPSQLEARTISTPLETLKKLDNVIGVAAGEKKVQAIRAVLRGKYLNVLVTDENTANSLIDDL